MQQETARALHQLLLCFLSEPLIFLCLDYLSPTIIQSVLKSKWQRKPRIAISYAQARVATQSGVDWSPNVLGQFYATTKSTESTKSIDTIQISIKQLVKLKLTAYLPQRAFRFAEDRKILTLVSRVANKQKVVCVHKQDNQSHVVCTLSVGHCVYFFQQWLLVWQPVKYWVKLFEFNNQCTLFKVAEVVLMETSAEVAQTNSGPMDRLELHYRDKSWTLTVCNALALKRS